MIVRKMQLRWAGHVARMSDDRIPKQLLFGELTTGTRTVGRPLLRWKDSLKDTLKQSNISITQWQDIATDRSTWRRSVHDELMLCDNSRRERNATKRARRHAARNTTSTASQDAYMCQHCGRTCSSRIGILSHERACQNNEDVTHDSHRRIDGQHYIHIHMYTYPNNTVITTQTRNEILLRYWPVHRCRPYTVQTARRRCDFTKGATHSTSSHNTRAHIL